MYNTFAILDNMIYHCWAWVNSESLRMTGTCPCVITIVAIKHETGSWRWATFAAVYTTIVAWVVSAVVYQIGILV